MNGILFVALRLVGHPVQTGDMFDMLKVNKARVAIVMLKQTF